MADKKKETAQPVETQEMIDTLVANGQAALRKMMELDQEQVDNIVHEMSLAGLDAHEKLAKMAVEETGRGVYEDKVIKNVFGSRGV